MTPGRVTFPEKTTIVGDRVLTLGVEVVIAERPEEQAKGLSGLTGLAENSGMVFWFGVRANHAFYMKNTRIPLDILFIDYSRVVGILTLQPMDLRPFACGRLSSAALEVNGGWAARHGVAVGDSAQISLV
jgi:hypothetical protein